MVTDTQLILNQMRQQLLALERQLFYLQMHMAQSNPPVTPPRPFSALRGVWEGVIVNEEDFEQARLKMPENL